MDLLVAYSQDQAGSNMASHISAGLEGDGPLYHGDGFDLLVIPTPAISADWLEEEYRYDGYVFLSKHAAESGVLALTAHSTGNFVEARFGGNPREIAVPHPDLHKSYMQNLYRNRSDFAGFDITIEATHHGPTALSKPAVFIEVGTTLKQWNDAHLCGMVADIVVDTMNSPAQKNPHAICIGGTHYPAKFTHEVIHGRYALGTVIPKHALGMLDGRLFDQIMAKNAGADAALLDWNGLGPNKQKVLDLLSGTDLEVIRL